MTASRAGTYVVAEVPNLHRRVIKLPHIEKTTAEKPSLLIKT